MLPILFLSWILIARFEKVLSTVINQELGDVRILYQNDLLGNSTSTSAFLVYKQQNFEGALDTCSTLHESLLPDVPSDVKDQLNFLVFDGQLKSDAKLYVANSSKEHCKAYHISTGVTKQVDCNADLSALCTQSSPPWNASQAGAPIATDRQITVVDGSNRYSGYRDARSFRFLGIPFAEPPVGKLRFEAPVRYDGSSHISALHHKKACIQAPTPYGAEFLNQISEDCLYLNVYTPFLPSDSSTAPMTRPVMVYLYGGSFLEGWSSLPDYDGGNLASRGDVLLVTLGYRVGALGFLATENIIHGNQGLQDQILALQWVQQHIAAFGGDPAQVTIFGQSAGAQSVVMQLSSSASKGLFAAAISQSSLLGVIPSTRSLNSKYITPAVAKGAKCSSNSSEDILVECLKRASADVFASKKIFEIVDEAAISAYAAYDDQIEGLAVAEPYLPITAASGGPSGIVDDQFVYLIGNDSVPNRVPFMVGTNRNEAGLFIPYSPGFETQLPDTQSEYAKKLRDVVPSDTRTAILKSSLWNLNTSNPEGVLDVSVDILTEYAWLCPWQDLVKRAAEKQIFPRLFNYVFDRGTPQALSAPPRCFPEDNPLGQQICHTEEIPEVFGRTDIYGYAYNATNSLQFSQYVIDTWISFARTHDPTPQRAYLEARGAAYRSTLQLSAQVPFAQYNSTTTGVVHRFDLPPFNSGPVYPGRCELLANSGGFAYDRVNNAI